MHVDLTDLYSNHVHDCNVTYICFRAVAVGDLWVYWSLLFLARSRLCVQFSSHGKLTGESAVSAVRTYFETV
jgi:hypothetical protein